MASRRILKSKEIKSHASNKMEKDFAICISRANIENDHFQKSHFFAWCGMMKKALFQKWSFSMVRQKIEK